MRKVIVTLFLSCLFVTQTVFANVCNNVKEYKLSNGQTVIIKEIKDNPIVVIDTYIKTGSVNENDSNNGVAHFLEHLFFKGTTNHKRGEFEKIIESRGGVFNAATSRDYTHYYIKIDSKYFEEALKLHADMLLNVEIPPNELDMERKVVMEEITRSQDNPGSKLFNNFMKIVFNGSPYSRTILGSNKIISSITRDEIFAFHDKWYVPENMVTVVVGDIDGDKILPLIAKNFSRVKHELKSADVLPVNPKPVTIHKNTIIEKADVDTGYIMIGYPTVGINNLEEAYALNIAAIMFAEGQTSVLYKVLKENENLILNSSAGNYELKNNGVFYTEVKFAPQNYEKVLKKVKTELNDFKNKPVDEKRLNVIKNSIKREFEYSNESVSSVAGTLGYDVAIGNGLKDYYNFTKTIDKITPELITDTMKKYFSDRNLALSVLLPENNKPVSLKKKKLVNGNTKTQLISTYKNIKKYKLSNGATLLLQKNPNNNIIATKIFIKGGSLVEEKNGTANILSSVIMKGTTKHTGKELENALDDIGTSINIGNTYEFFEATMKTTNNDWNSAFPLFKEIIEEPAFSEKDINNAKTDALRGIRASKDNPQNIAFDNFYDGLYKNSKFLKTSAVLEKSIPHITRNDVVNLHNNIFNSENMIISVAGNFNEQDIINKFSELKKGNSEIYDIDSLIKTSLQPLKQNEIKQESKNTGGAWLVQGWQTKGLSTNDFAALKIISTYLGSGLSSKLFVNLRENKGLAYEVGSNSSSNFNSGVFFMYIGTNPENLPEVKNDFAKEINLLKNKKLTDKELNDIKTTITGRLKLATETNMAKAYINGYYEFFDKGYQFGYDYPVLIQKVTTDDIIRVANKYFSQPYVMSIVAENKYLQGKK